MDTELAILKALIANTDLRVYADNDILLNYALDYAVSEVNKRRCYTGDGYEAKFRQNVIEGAVWRLNPDRPAFCTKRCCGRGRPRSRLPAPLSFLVFPPEVCGLSDDRVY